MGKKRNKKKQNRVVADRLAEQIENEAFDDVAEEFKDKEDPDSIENALYDDYKDIIDEEIEEETEEISEEPEEKTVERPNKFYLVFAVFIIVMSIIGVVSDSE